MRLQSLRLAGVGFLCVAMSWALAGCGGGMNTDSGRTDSGSTDAAMSTCDPDLVDSDGDGIADVNEDLNGNGVVDPDECDPNDADSDDDGLLDEVEVGCDGVFKMGLDTACDNPDTDGDGLVDGIEDADGDGEYEPAKGETDPAVADSDGDGCDDGEESVMGTDPNNTDSDMDGISDGFEDRNCDGVVDLDEGETDPNNMDTDGDGTPDNMEPTIVCNPATPTSVGGLRPVQFFDDTNGDWTLALEENSMAEGRTVTYDTLTLSGVGSPPTDTRAAAAFEYLEMPAAGPTVELAGFVVSIPTDADGDGVLDTTRASEKEVRDQAVALLSTTFGAMGGVTVRSTGTNVVAWDGFGSVVSVVLSVSIAATSTPGGVRSIVLPTLMGLPLSAFTNLAPSFGVSATNFIITFEVVWRSAPDPASGSPGRAVIVGAVVSELAYDVLTDPTGIRARDLANGTALGEAGSTSDTECDPFESVELPVADILWVVDDSASTSAFRTSIKDNSVDFFDNATGAGLDFRMSVTSMGPDAATGPAAGFICDPPAGATVSGPGVDCGLSTPNPGFNNPQPADGRWMGAAERDEFGWCVCYPPNGNGGLEYGLETARAAVLHPNMVPRMNDPAGRRLRPEASLTVIYISNEPAQGPGYSLMFPVVPGSSDYINFVQPHIDWLNGMANAANTYPAGATPADGMGRAHGILSLGSGGICFGEAAGYIEVVNAVGGQIGDVCAMNVGPTMQLILDDILAGASTLVLDRTPISASLACAINDTFVARSRSMGFDYNPAANAVVFPGLGAMLQNADSACSYRYYVP